MNDPQPDDDYCPLPCCDRATVIHLAELLAHARRKYLEEMEHHASALDCLQDLERKGWLRRMTARGVYAAMDDVIHAEAELVAAEARLAVLGRHWVLRGIR